MMDILKLQACSEQNSREVVEKLGGTVSVLRQKRAQTPEDCCYGAKTEIGCGTTGGSVTGREESIRSDAWFFLQKRMKSEL